MFGKSSEFKLAVWGYCLANGPDALLQVLYSLIIAYVSVNI